MNAFMPANLSCSTLTLPLTLPMLLRPLGAYQLSGLTWLTPEHLKAWAPSGLPQTQQGGFLALDKIRGYLLLLPMGSDSPEILNPHDVQGFIDARGLWVTASQLWFCRGCEVYVCNLPSFTAHLFTSLPYPATGVTVADEKVYVTCQKSGYIHVYHQHSRDLLDKLSAPGIGEQNLSFHQGQLWVCDKLEQSVYCLDPATGSCLTTVLTPFEQPTALAFAETFAADSDTSPLYVAYAGDEPYLRENPNHPTEPLEISIRDRTFLHALSAYTEPKGHYTLSNGYLVEMTYLEELSPLEHIHQGEPLQDLVWQIALPTATHRQKVLHVEPVGLPFTEIRVEDQRVAQFQFPQLKPKEARLFGWKARLELRGIKYHFTPAMVEQCPALSPEFQAQYLVDNDQLAMDKPIVQAAARHAVGTETNLLRKVLKIRNYVYDRLSYALIPQIDTPDVVLERGVGSCGEYVGVLLALMRLNGIACRTVGRYKCPPFQGMGVPLQPDYNHVWLEFYIPDFGWIPMESNPDDVVERGPYPTRFFMGLPWYHVEIGKGIRFETTNYRDKGLRLGDLAINHVRFTILQELPAQNYPL
jgi:transglutaminase-like putative cysteine protease